MNAKTNICKQYDMARAFEFIKSNLSKQIVLDEISDIAGASRYHFIRVFSAYTGETPFTFISREKIVLSLKLLLKNKGNMTQIAFDSGFESSSSFNKVFKKLTLMSPTEYRNLGKDAQEKLLYTLSMTPKAMEMSMNIDMNLIPEIMSREKMTVYTFKNEGDDFRHVAPLAWEGFMKQVENIKEDLSKSEFMGIGYIENKDNKQICHYKAALTQGKRMKFPLLYPKTSV